MVNPPVYDTVVCVVLPGADGVMRYVAGTVRSPEAVTPPANFHGDPLVELPIDRVAQFRTAFPFLEDPSHPWPPPVDTGFGTTIEEVAAFALEYPDDLPLSAVPWDGVAFELAQPGGQG